MRVAVFLVLTGLAAGCGGARTVAADPSSDGNSQQRLSAGVLGCRPGSIEITEARGGEVDTWVARCAGRSIICAWAPYSTPLCTDLVE